MEFEAEATTQHLRIAAVTIDPAFSRVIDRSSSPLPGRRFQVVCLQPRLAVDQSLGSRGSAVPFATIEMEVLSDVRFRSALRVRARAALVGGEPVATSIMNGRPVVGRRARGRISVLSLHPVNHGTGQVSLKVEPIGGGARVSVLEPDTTYELHYAASFPRVNGFVLFAVGTSPDVSLAAAVPPDQGPWSASDGFVFIDLPGPSGDSEPAFGYPAGFHRYTCAANILPSEGAAWAGPTGHLCNFTTGAAGELNLHLYLWWAAPQGDALVESETQAAFPVPQ